jgi:predicted nuclease of predicted toxin-antitoxin system
MKFLCDVHISYKVVNFLSGLGYETIHINQILNKWNTRDKDICSYADLNGLIVITKDYDFLDSFFLRNTPKKLIKINLGNISTTDLIKSFSDILEAIERLNSNSSFLVEIGKNHTTFTGNQNS